MNTEKYSTVKIEGPNEAIRDALFPSFVSSRRITDTAYAVEQQGKYYRCDTCLQCAIWTLDNAKLWYLRFVYEFMVPCLQMNRIHYVEGDTDSYYWAVAGDPTHPKGVHQGFESVIADKDFYEANVYKWFADPAITKNPEVTIEVRFMEEKKPLKLAIEREGCEMIALAPKCYTMKTERGSILKNKGVSTKESESCAKALIWRDGVLVPLCADAYMVPLTTGQAVNSTSKQLRVVKKGAETSMMKLEVMKRSLSGIHSKMIVLSNQNCAPFIHGLTTLAYIVV
jgi:hypothetical protein